MSQPEETQPDPAAEPLTASERFEKERMSRRAALRKLGITSAATLLGVFAVDDFARMAIRVMEQNKATEKVAEVLAHDFKDAGVAHALTPHDICYSQASTAFIICNNLALENFFPLIAQIQCRADYQNNLADCDKKFGITSGNPVDPDS